MLQIYLVVKTSVSSHVKLVASKMRVSPISGQTIPRLELLAALLLAKLMASVLSSLELELTLAQPTSHDDSKAALYWILGSDKEWKQFAQNRVSEIRKLLPAAQWKRCGQDNMADLLSRGLPLAKVAVSSLWWHGPSSLKRLNVEPDFDNNAILQECISEMKVKD